MSYLSDETSKLLELIAIFLVPLLLSFIHFLVPASIQNALAFYHEPFNVYGLFTGAFVHASDTHLLGNLAGYLIASLYAYALCASANERSWFRRTVTASILVLPVLVNLVSYAFFQFRFPEQTPVSRGFSGVVAGLSGFLLVALAVYVKSQHNRDLGHIVGVTIFLLVMAEIDFIYAGGLRPLLVGLVLLGIFLQWGSYLKQYSHNLQTLSDRRILLDTAGVTFVFIVLSFVVVSLFPSNIVQDGSFRNIIAHAVGLLMGIVLSAGLYYRGRSTPGKACGP